MHPVEIKDLSFGYGEDKILNNISLTIEAGSFLVLIGPNGGGKSTLLKLILGLLKPDSGTIKLFGSEISEGVRLVGYVPQDSEQIKLFPVNALDTAMMGFYRPGAEKLSKKEIRERALNALHIFGMADYADKKLGELSTGQRQRVLIARAVATKPRLLAMDEPISGVDPAGQELVLTTLKSYLKESTVIFVSHDLSVIPDNATAVACINRGLHYHPSGELTPELLSYAYGEVASLALVSHECRCPDGSHN